MSKQTRALISIRYAFFGHVIGGEACASYSGGNALTTATTTVRVVRAWGGSMWISSLRVELAQIIVEGEALIPRVQQCKIVLAPVRRVPPELLCEIFQLAVSREAKAPWRLGHVCRSWREAALGCRPLWSLLKVSHGFDFPPVPRAMLALETQILRTGNGLLDIDFQWGLGVQDALQNGCWDLFLPLSHRWRTLRIHCHYSMYAKALLQRLKVVKNHLPQLERVEFLVSVTWSADPDMHEHWDIFSTAPRLREICLTDRLLSNPSLTLVVPPQVTRYRGVLSDARQLDILQGSPELVECSLGVRPGDSFMGQGDRMAHSPLLRRLHMKRCEILAHVIAPALLDLVVYKATPSLSRFLLRSSCQLTSLVITDGDYFADNLTPAVELCSGLERLVLAISPSTNSTILGSNLSSLFNALCVSTSTHICPTLTTFTFGWPVRPGGGTQLKLPWTESLFRMLHSRCITKSNTGNTDNRQPFRSVRLFNAYYGDGMWQDGDTVGALPPGMHEGILQLEDEGMDIKYLTAAEGRALMDGLAW
ncbi:hypothetical protein FB45DRAFT_1006314 [Roridomyces roridus]|uniref:F-box domain-containing protein n=1 Tax=Roridomyces roridus TaxID=1738132 RepID=A0AAD7FIJ2_9AGAR|nr:hypothetical protein FB45DRAFT_1006314 [Roridomyces roridus]